MKKILLSLFMAVASLGFANAQTTIDCTSLTWAGVAEKAATISASSGGYTITINQGGGATKPTQNGTTKDIRAYAGNTITVAGSANMTKAVFDISAAGLKRLSSQNTVDNGSVVSSATDATVTWNGTGTSFTITVGANADLGTEGASKAGQLDFNSIVISSGAATDVASPSFSPKGGTYYEPQTISISCGTEGATIQYSIDGGDPVTYSAPFLISKSCSIVAQATKAGLTASKSVSEDYVISSIPTVANIAAFEALDDNAIAKITGAVTVIYQSGKYLFVQDASGALQVYGTLTNTYKNGDVLTGIYGTVGTYGGLKQMVPNDDSFGTATAGTAVVAQDMAIDGSTTALINKLVKIANVTITLDAGKTKNYTLTQGSKTLAAYARFDDVTIPTDTKAYDVTGVLNSYNGTYQLFPTAFDINGSVAGVDVDNAINIVGTVGAVNVTVGDNAQALIVNAAGQMIANQAVLAGENTISVAPGFYIVKVANTVTKVIVK